MRAKRAYPCTRYYVRYRRRSHVEFRRIVWFSTNVRATPGCTRAYRRPFSPRSRADKTEQRTTIRVGSSRSIHGFDRTEKSVLETENRLNTETPTRRL